MRENVAVDENLNHVSFVPGSIHMLDFSVKVDDLFFGKDLLCEEFDLRKIGDEIGGRICDERGS